MQQVQTTHFHESKRKVNLRDVEDSLLILHKMNWSTSVRNFRRYMHFKQNFETEKYSLSTLTKVES